MRNQASEQAFKDLAANSATDFLLGLYMDDAKRLNEPSTTPEAEALAAVRKEAAEAGGADFIDSRYEAPSRAAERQKQQVRDAKKQVENSKKGIFTVAQWFTEEKLVPQGQMKHIRPFVDWAVEVYAFSSAEIVPCWWRHPELASEWMALWHAYRVGFSQDDSGTGPCSFHLSLQNVRMRMRAYIQGLTCTAHEHREKSNVLRNITAISDEQWARLTGQEKVPEGVSAAEHAKSVMYVPPCVWPRFEGGTDRGSDGSDRATAG